MGLWNTRGDNPGRTATVTIMATASIRDGFNSSGREASFVRKTYDGLMARVQKLEEYYKRLVDGEDCDSYVRRMSVCREQFRKVRDVLDNQDLGFLELSGVLLPLGFVYAEVTGMERSFREILEKVEDRELQSV